MKKNNWRRDIRSANEPSILLNRPTTPPLLKSINKRARNLKKKGFYQNSQNQWISYYNKLIDEYHKIESEINGLYLNIDVDNNLHLKINQHRQEYSKWMQSISNILCNFYLSDKTTYQSVQKMKDVFNDENNELNAEQQNLEKELNQFQKSIDLLDASNVYNVSMRKENLKYYEFCLQHDIHSGNNCGGWTHENHQKFVTISDQYRNKSVYKLYDEFKLHFPDKTKKDIKLHYEWYRLYLQHISTNKRMRKEMRMKNKLLMKKEKTNQLIESSLNRLTLKEQTEQKLFESKLANLHNKVVEIQQIKSDQMRQNELLKEKEAEQEKLKQMEQKIKWNGYRNDQKRKLNDYYQDKITKLEVMELEGNIQKEKQKIKQKELDRVNRKRIEYRKNKWNEKNEIQRELASKFEQEVEMKELRLSKLRESVTKTLNHDNIDNICGVLRDTENVKNRLNNNGNEVYNEGTINMFPSYGYSDKQLFQDPKFVLMNHLISKNLHKNEYAKQCIKNTDAVVKPRKDCNHIDIF